MAVLNGKEGSAEQKDEKPKDSAPPSLEEGASISWRCYFSKETLDATRPDDVITATATRTYCVDLITELSRLLGFPVTTWASAILLCTRYYTAHPLMGHPRFHLSVASLFVAGKIEETYKRLRDILQVAITIPEVGKEAGQPFDDLHQEIIKVEKLVFRSIRFDVGIRHPFHFIPKYTLRLKGDKELGGVAWELAKSAYSSTLPLQFPPHTLAAASLVTSILISPHRHVGVPLEGPWAAQMLIRWEDLCDAADQMIKLTDVEEIEKNKAKARLLLLSKSWSTHPAFAQEPKNVPVERPKAEPFKEDMTLRYIFKDQSAESE